MGDKQISRYDMIEDILDGKTIRHAFSLSETIYIGFTDGTWLGIQAEKDWETGDPNFSDAPSIDELPEVLDNWHPGIVDEFEKAGIIQDGAALREDLRKRREQHIKQELAMAEGQIKRLTAELGKVSRGQNDP